MARWFDTASTPFVELFSTWIRGFQIRQSGTKPSPKTAVPPRINQLYHLLAENDQNYYVAYVSEQNLIADYSGEPVRHPDISDMFGHFDDGNYELQYQLN